MQIELWGSFTLLFQRALLGILAWEQTNRCLIDTSYILYSNHVDFIKCHLYIYVTFTNLSSIIYSYMNNYELFFLLYLVSNWKVKFC